MSYSVYCVSHMSYLFLCCSIANQIDNLIMKIVQNDGMDTRLFSRDSVTFRQCRQFQKKFTQTNDQHFKSTAKFNHNAIIEDFVMIKHTVMLKLSEGDKKKRTHSMKYLGLKLNNKNESTSY